MIQFGQYNINSIYVGSDRIQEVYYGSEKVWEDSRGYWVHKDTGVKTYFTYGDVNIGEGIMDTPSWATSASEVKIPRRILGLAPSCFYNCQDLTSIILPADLASIGDSCFYNCAALTSITLPKSIIRLENNCLRFCSSLTSITLPENITYLGSNCLNGCTSLTSIYSLKSTAPSAGSGAFGGSTYNYTGRNTYSLGVNKLYVPQGATGYEAGVWLDPLQNALKCGFTISYTL